MRPWLVVLAAGCQLPDLRTAESGDLFGGGDGLVPSQDRVLRGLITQDTTLDAAAPWILDGLVDVGDDDTHDVDLVIEPGTIIYGNPTTRGTLVIHRGSRILANGTASQPIVFTSPRARGARAAGDWGGVVIDGRAPVNCPAPCVLEGEGYSGLYGGDDPDDDSGILRYTRIEFAGALYSPENELNGLALQGVGRGTTIDYLQLHVASDDGIEFFGGTVDVKHVLVTGAQDDSFDWTYGWSGRAQFIAAQQHPGVGDRGIEADNSDVDNYATPRSHPVLTNMTLVSQPGNVGTGVLLRRGTAAYFTNSIVFDFATALDINDDSTWTNAYDEYGLPSGEIDLEGDWFDCATNWSASGWDVHTVESLMTTDFADNTFADPGMVNPLDLESPNLRLSAGSPALTAAIPGVADPFFETVAYVGAFDSLNDWTAGWTTGGTN